MFRLAGLLLCCALHGTAPAQARIDPLYPARKPGLWEIQSSVYRSNGLGAVRQCVGPGSDTAIEHLDRKTGKRGFCQLSPFRRHQDIWIAESTCRHSSNIATTRKIASGDFLSRYQIDTIVQTRDGNENRVLVEDTLTARYLGPCKKGQRADDLVAPGMGTLNMSDGAFTAEEKLQ
ncbi:MAG: DUF3617 family protein [Burkholderiaceae bacterium]